MTYCSLCLAVIARMQGYKRCFSSLGPANKKANYYKGSRWSYNSAGAIEYCDGQNNPDTKFTLIIGYLQLNCTKYLSR